MNTMEDNKWTGPRGISWAAGMLGLLFFLWGQGGPISRTVQEHPYGTAAVLLLASAAVVRRFREVLARGFDRVCRMPRARFNGLVFGAALAMYAAMAWFVFDGIPRLDDGIASLFQGRLLARGVLTLPLPERAYFYNMFGVLGFRQGVAHWCGMYPPGWPLLLAPGVWLGAPWLVNPLLGALLVVAIGELGRDLFGLRTGRAAALLALPSPMMLVLSGLHLSHMPTALFLCLAVLSLRKLWATARWGWGASAGGAWGIAFLCRPLDAVVVGVVLILGFLAPARRLWRCRLGIVAGLAVALLAVGVLLGFQQVTTGDWLTPGHEVGMGRAGTFGFSEYRNGRLHTPERGIEHTFHRLRAVNDQLLGWAVPSLLIVMLPFLTGRARVKEALLLLPLPVLLVTFAHYWYLEICYPGRYLFTAAPYLFVLAARGLFTLREAAGGHRVWSRAPVFLAVSGILFLAVSLPHHLRRFGPDYYDVEGVLPRVVRDYGIRHALVFMDAIGIDQRKVDVNNDYYGTGFLRNDLELAGDVVYVRNLRERNLGLMDAFPGRSAYLYRYVRPQEKAFLWRLERDGGELREIPVEPRTPDLLPVPE
ncbi:MAG: hypothetical protein GX548_03810 [Lentisphaerae bacterium]|nr:hypothetical protein [Lentisphaerota bacterium]